MSQVLSLKYRPRNFSELVGQESVSMSLSHALDMGRVGHAYLFSGLRGSGKTSSARIFAKALLCEKGPTSHPCEECTSCKMANEGTHIDIIEMDAASRRKIDDIRELIERTKTYPTMSRYKVFIIDEVHMLTKEASNAFLKTLEEPLEYVKFILATTDPLKLPATILSRTQHFRFKPIARNLVISHLANILNKENIPYEDESLEIISRMGEGSLRDSITLLDQSISYTKGDLKANLVASMLGLLDPAKIDEILNLVVRQDRQAIINLLEELDSHDTETIIDQFIANLKDKFLKRDPKFSILMYERFFRILSEAKNMLSMGSDNSFTMAMTLFLLMEALNLRSIDEAINSNLQNSIKETVQNSTKQNSNIPLAVAKDLSPYDKYVDNLYDRDYDLGECFKEAVEYIKFENNTLFVVTHADGKNREILRKSSRAILDVLKQTFDENTKIDISQPSVTKIETKDDFVDSSKFSNIENIINLSNNKNNNYKDESRKMLDELKSLNSQQESKEEKNFNELKRLFGEPTRVIDN